MALQRDGIDDQRRRVPNDARKPDQQIRRTAIRSEKAAAIGFVEFDHQPLVRHAGRDVLQQVA